jgi:hypothetical protein
MTEIEEIDEQIREAGKRIWQYRKQYYQYYPVKKVYAILLVAIGYIVVISAGGLWSLLGALIVFIGLVIGFFGWADNLPDALIYGDKIDMEKQTIAELRARKRAILRSRKHV